MMMEVKRPEEIEVEYSTLEGETVITGLDGFKARVNILYICYRYSVMSLII